MKTAKDYSRAKTLYYKPELKLCPNCQTPLQRSHVTWRKHVIALNGIHHVTSLAYKCSNINCPHPEAVYRSMQAEMLSIKHYQFSLDVIAKVGHLRFKEHQTIRQIKCTLNRNFKLQISRSEVNLLCQVYLALIKANKQHDTAFLEKLRNNGGVVLSIDGLQPEKGNETLWILRDVLTGEVLLAKNLTCADTDSIVSLLNEIKALNVPVKGVISDGQRSIRLAVAQEFPGVPHQLCHFHFLRNIAKPVSDMDRALKVDLKKKVRGIRAIKRKAKARSDQKAKVILGICEAIYVYLQEDGVYPLKPAGLRLWRALSKIQKSIQKNQLVQKSKGLEPDGDFERLLKVLSIVDELKAQYHRVRRLYKFIFEVGVILGQNAGAEKVQADMQAYVERLTKLQFRRQAEKAAVQNILRYTASYWEGLFHHYDHPQIPRTNNDLERFNRKLKSAHRKTTGRASCQGFIVRYGSYVAFLDSSVSQRETLFRLCRVPYGDFRLCYLEIRSFKLRLSFKRCINKDLGGFLRDLEQLWAEMAV